MSTCTNGTAIDRPERGAMIDFLEDGHGFTICLGFEGLYLARTEVPN
jgi:hypothetical protein